MRASHDGRLLVDGIASMQTRPGGTWVAGTAKIPAPCFQRRAAWLTRNHAAWGRARVAVRWFWTIVAVVLHLAVVAAVEIAVAAVVVVVVVVAAVAV